MYKMLIVYSLQTGDILKNRTVTAMIKQDVCKTVLQMAGWALLMPFLYICLFFSK
jgi:hypothetical protein